MSLKVGSVVSGIEHQTANARVSHLYLMLMSIEFTGFVSEVVTLTEVYVQNITGLTVLHRVNLRGKNLEMRIYKGGSEDLS